MTNFEQLTYRGLLLTWLLSCPAATLESTLFFAVLHGQPTRILPDFVEHVDLQ